MKRRDVRRSIAARRSTQLSRSTGFAQPRTASSSWSKHVLKVHFETRFVAIGFGAISPYPEICNSCESSLSCSCASGTKPPWVLLTNCLSRRSSTKGSMLIDALPFMPFLSLSCTVQRLKSKSQSVRAGLFCYPWSAFWGLCIGWVRNVTARVIRNCNGRVIKAADILW